MIEASLRPVGVPLRAPLATAHGEVCGRELLVLTLRDSASGLTGHGEAAPLAGYDGVSARQVAAAIRDCGEPLTAAALDDALDPQGRARLLAECGRRAVLPQALAAIDLALWDLAGRAAGEPVWRLLGAGAPAVVELNWSVAAADRAGAASEAAAALAAGFGTVKLKVAIGDDAGRVSAVRAAGGPRLAIRLDANGGWGSQAEAWRSLEALAPAGIECCEEPVHGAEAIARLQSRTTMPLALDESAGDPAAGQHRCARAICLKVSRSGGIAGLLRDGRRARRLGYEVYLASTYDGPLGIAAALHAAAALTLDRPCGLATLSLFDRPDPLPPGGGRLAPPDGPGLGPDLPGWYVD